MSRLVFIAEALPDGRYRLTLPSGAVFIAATKLKALAIEEQARGRTPGITCEWKEGLQ